MSKVRLWSDVPKTERITEKDLQGVAARFPMPSTWLRKHLDLLRHPRCLVATKWGERWRPCSIPPRDGERFCAKHGGPKRPGRADKDALILEELHLRLLSFETQADIWQCRIDQAQGELAGLKIRIIELQARIQRAKEAQAAAPTEKHTR